LGFFSFEEPHQQYSVYDFGYLLKMVTNDALPTNENDFFTLLFIWFPCIYDIKYIIRSVKTLRGGLQEIGESLGVRISLQVLDGKLTRQLTRIGPQHQAGSDSLLTASVFFKLRSTYFDNKLDDEYYR
jgi:CCR4-NOT transcription complex subunit 7/8